MVVSCDSFLAGESEFEPDGGIAFHRGQSGGAPRLQKATHHTARLCQYGKISLLQILELLRIVV